MIEELAIPGGLLRGLFRARVADVDDGRAVRDSGIDGWTEVIGEVGAILPYQDDLAVRARRRDRIEVDRRLSRVDLTTQTSGLVDDRQAAVADRARRKRVIGSVRRQVGRG